MAAPSSIEGLESEGLVSDDPVGCDGCGDGDGHELVVGRALVPMVLEVVESQSMIQVKVH
jgi:hypothetical protein